MTQHSRATILCLVSLALPLSACRKGERQGYVEPYYVLWSTSVYLHVSGCGFYVLHTPTQGNEALLNITFSFVWNAFLNTDIVFMPGFRNDKMSILSGVKLKKNYCKISCLSF